MMNATTENVAKKRIGRPPGRKAPHRPVLSVSARVSAEDYALVTAAAKASSRTLSEEAAWRVARSFEWEKALEQWKKAHESAQAMLDKTRHVTDQTTQRSLENELRRRGYTKVRGINGAAWFEPGVNSITWIMETSVSRELLEAMMEGAVTRALNRLAGRAPERRKP